MPKSLSIIGVPLDLGAQNLGVSAGPKALRDVGIIDKLSGIGFKTKDSGDVVPTARDRLKQGNPRLRYLDEIVKISSGLASEVEATLREGHCPIVLGGDHSVCLGAVAGASVALGSMLGLIYIDAHGDLNTDKTTPTGNIHGMHLASLLGFGDPALRGVNGSDPKLSSDNLLLIGGSDYDKAEIDLIKSENIQSFSIFDLLTNGLGQLWPKIEALSEKVQNIWVSLDLDAIDQTSAPAAGMPNAKGLSYREITTIAQYIGQKCHVIGMDVVEYSPSTDQENKTAELAIELIAAVMGGQYSWYTNYLSRNQRDLT